MYPEHLQSLFGDARFHPLSLTEFLEFEGAEFILSGVTSDVVRDLGAKGAELELEEFNDNRAKILGVLRKHLVHNSNYLNQVINEDRPNDEPQQPSSQSNNERSANVRGGGDHQLEQQQPHQIKSLSQ